MEYISPADYLPNVPPDINLGHYGIGLVGCGSIANTAHLPGYRKAGLKVVACCDINPDAARTTAEKFGIPFWTTDIRELLNLETVRIIDLALHVDARLSALREISRAPRPVLSQKPLAMTFVEATQMFEEIAKLGLVVGVNQQARFAPAHRAMMRLIERGTIGQVYSIHHAMRSYQDQPDYWWATMRNFNIADHGNHYIDLCRYFAKASHPACPEWSRVHCSTTRLGDQNAIDPLIYTANVEFGPAGGREGTIASLYFNNIVRGFASHQYTWWVDGTEGSVGCRHDRVVLALGHEPSTLHEIKIKGSWFPDGFSASMAAFVTKVARGQEVPVSVADNLRTVALAQAMILSSAEGRAVTRAEIMGESDHWEETGHE